MGQLLLAIFLIVWGICQFVPAVDSRLVGVFGVVVGILLLVGR